LHRPAYHVFRQFKSMPPTVQASKFTAEHDATLLSLAALPSNKSKTGKVNWSRVAAGLSPFTFNQCKLRFRRINGVRKGRWTPSEDTILRNAVNALGEGAWEALAQRVEGRSGLQCRERWIHCLKPGLKRGVWTEEDEIKLVGLVNEQKKGSSSGLKVSWTDIAQDLGNGKTKDQCRSRFVVISKRV
jgi:hypothetical protein